MKLEEATNNDPWGPHGKLLAEIAAATYDYEGYMEIMTSLDGRFQKAIAKPERWRLAYKSLLVLEHMAKHGDARCVDGLRKEGALRTLDRLAEFKYVDPASMKDHGINVRNRAELLRDFVKDPQRILEERTKARANRGKYTGVSSMGEAEGFGADSNSLAGGGGAAVGRSGNSKWDAAPERKRWGSVSQGPTVAPPAESFLTEAPASPAAAVGLADGGLARRSNGGGYQAPAAVAPPEPRRPKTLSETKVNPAIAASFGGLAVPSQPAAPAPAAAVRAPAQDPMADLMGLDVPAPAAAPAADPFAAASAAPAATQDPFGGAFVQATMPATSATFTAQDPFATAAAAPASGAGFGSFAQPQGRAVPAMQMGGAAPAMQMGGAAPAMQMGGAMPAMGMGGAMPAIGSGMGAMQMGGAAGAGQIGAGMFVSSPTGAGAPAGATPSSPSQPSAAKDPFADLLG